MSETVTVGVTLLSVAELREAAAALALVYAWEGDHPNEEYQTLLASACSLSWVAFAAGLSDPKHALDHVVTVPEFTPRRGRK